MHQRVPRYSISISLLFAALIVPAVARGGILTAGPGQSLFGVEGAAQLFTVGTFFDADPNDLASQLTAQVSWGDAITSPGIITGGNGQFTVSASHTYSEEGSYTTSFQAADLIGDAVITRGSAQIIDAALSAGQFIPFAAVVGTPGGGTVGTFSDANPFGLPSDFTALVNWGDGAPPSLAAITSLGGAIFGVNGQHVYNVAGVFVVLVNVTDVGGSTTSFSGPASVSSVPEPGSVLIAGAGLVLIALRCASRL